MASATATAVNCMIIFSFIVSIHKLCGQCRHNCSPLSHNKLGALEKVRSGTALLEADTQYAEVYWREITGKRVMKPNSEIIIYQSPTGNIKIDVFLKDETVWLTQEQMAQLFGKGRSTITEHIGNIFKEGELNEEVVCRNFRHTT